MNDIHKDFRIYWCKICDVLIVSVKGHYNER